MDNISPPSSILERTTEGFGAAGSLGYHDMPHSEIFLSALKCFLGKKKKIRASPACHIPSLILSPSLTLSILWLPLCTYLLRLSAFPPPSPLFLFSVWQLSGPTWPGLISVSYGSWRVKPSPLNTDWLAGLISSLRTLCSLPSSARRCAVRARPDGEECGEGASTSWLHTESRTYTSAERGYIWSNLEHIL